MNYRETFIMPRKNQIAAHRTVKATNAATAIRIPPAIVNIAR